jgi:HEAT repeat protein
MNTFFVGSLSFAILIFPIGWRTSRAGAIDDNEPVYKGKPLSALVKPLRDKDARVRREAISVLKVAVFAQLKEDWDWELAEQTVPFFNEAIKDKDAQVRAVATEALDEFNIGPKAEAEVARLIQALQDKDPQVRLLAADHLAFRFPAAKAAASALTKALKDPDSAVRLKAAITMGFLGPEGKAAVPLLIEGLKQEIRFLDCTRMDAAIALGRIGPDAKAAIPALTESLRDELFFVRPEAALALGKIGPAAKAALPDLRRALKDEKMNTRVSAAVALWWLEGKAKEPLPVLIEALQGRGKKGCEPVESGTIKLITTTLGEMGPKAREAIPLLMPLLKDREWSIRRAAADALKKIDPEVAKKTGLR